METTLPPITYDPTAPAPVQGWLYRYPNGVVFQLPKSRGEIDGPVYVAPYMGGAAIPTPFGGESFVEFYKPTALQIRHAVVELSGMAQLDNDALEAAIDRFVREFGPIACTSDYLEQILGGNALEEIPDDISRAMEADRLRQDLTVSHYRHEATVLRNTLSLYSSIRHKRIDDLDDWEWAWMRLLQRIRPYLTFLRVDIDMGRGRKDLRATSPDNLIPFVPEQLLVAEHLLGAMYLHILQVVLGGQFVRSCSASNCNRMFIPSRSDQIYCTPSCASSERSRRHRQKSRVEKG